MLKYILSPLYQPPVPEDFEDLTNGEPILPISHESAAAAQTLSARGHQVTNYPLSLPWDKANVVF
jgi:hypothetical protein